MGQPQISLNSVIGRRDSFLSSRVDTDELVMMDLNEGNYYGLGSVAARIWDLIEQPKRIRDVCEELIAEYQISVEECHEEVLVFVGDLLTRNIVQVVAPASDDAGL
jgi:hypothetical protein